MINNNEIRKRVTIFLTELGVPMTAFCRNVGISSSYGVKWKSGIHDLPEAKLKRIDEYLCKYGF